MLEANVETAGLGIGREKESQLARALARSEAEKNILVDQLQSVKEDFKEFISLSQSMRDDAGLPGSGNQ